MGTTDNNNWTRVQQSVREAERLIGQKQYNLAMIKSRQALEFMVNCLGEKALIVDGDLADSIDQLFEGHHSDMADGNIMTEYEEKFSSMGNAIFKLVAERKRK